MAAVSCPRCHQPADTATFTIHNMAGQVVVNSTTYFCTFPGCVDELGSHYVDPPDMPGELTRTDRAAARTDLTVPCRD